MMERPTVARRAALAVSNWWEWSGGGRALAGIWNHDGRVRGGVVDLRALYRAGARSPVSEKYRHANRDWNPGEDQEFVQQ